MCSAESSMVIFVALSARASSRNCGGVRGCPAHGLDGGLGARGARRHGPGDGGRRTSGPSRRGAHQGTCSAPHLARMIMALSPTLCRVSEGPRGACARTLVPPLRPGRRRPLSPGADIVGAPLVGSRAQRRGRRRAAGSRCDSKTITRPSGPSPSLW